MLQPKSSKESIKQLRSSLLSGSEIRLIYNEESCCSKNCMQNMISGSSRSGHSSRTTSSSSSSSSTTSSSMDNFLYCQSINIPVNEIPSLSFDQFLEEVRRPFCALQAGTDSAADASEQLRYYLVQKFTENRVYDPENKQNYLYIYQLHSLSRGVLTVCKTAYIIMTGVSIQAIDYAQRLVRKEISAESIILGKSDGDSMKSRGDSLKDAFQQFSLDYNLYEQNINHFVDVMKIPESTTAFMCVTFLAEWFELAGDQEVIYYYTSLFIISSIISWFIINNNVLLFISQTRMKFTSTPSVRQKFGMSTEQIPSYNHTPKYTLIKVSLKYGGMYFRK